MKLTVFSIQNYKIIDDTSRIPVDSNVTALVGKNESGKTAILKSLWKSKNVAGVGFDKLYDYPRDRYARERKQDQDVVTLEFALTDPETQELATKLPSAPGVPITNVTFTTSYNGEEHVTTKATFGQSHEELQKLCFRPAADARKAIEVVLTAFKQSLGNEDPNLFTPANQALAKIDGAQFLWDKAVLDALNAFFQQMHTWINQDRNRSGIAQIERKQLDDIIALAEEGDPMSPAQTWLTENLPAFIYFDDYGQLETRINLPTFINRTQKPDSKTRTQQALFEWSGLPPQEILDLGKPKAGTENDDQVQRRKEKRRALLDSASFSLTGDWANWWDGKRHKLHFDVDGDDLVLKVSDEHNEFPIPFEERSKGFQWFFSFYLVFLVESKRAHKKAILLLDEPGLHLHPSLQTKLTSLFDRISKENQLLYSTHLPFLVDGNRLDRVRTVHLHGPDPQKTKVSNDVRPTGDRDTLFPLQAAVGYSIAQTLFLGKRTVIVEGITDYWIIKALSNCIAATKKTGALHSEVVLVPAGGTSRLMPLASIMLSTTGIDGRRLLVLLDSDQAGQQAAKNLEDTFSTDANVRMLATAIDKKQATIEDLIPRDIYLKALADAGYAVTLQADEEAIEMTTAALGKAFLRLGLGQFGTEHKAVAALKLVDAWARDPKSVPTETVVAAEKLFAAINLFFDAEAVQRHVVKAELH